MDRWMYRRIALINGEILRWFSWLFFLVGISFLGGPLFYISFHFLFSISFLFLLLPSYTEMIYYTWRMRYVPTLPRLLYPPPPLSVRVDFDVDLWPSATSSESAGQGDVMPLVSSTNKKKKKRKKLLRYTTR